NLMRCKDYERSLSFHLRSREHAQRCRELPGQEMWIANHLLANDLETGLVQQAMGRSAEAMATFQRGFNDAERWLDRYNDRELFIDRLIFGGTELGRAEQSRGQPAAAIQTYQRVLSKVGRLTNLNATALYNLACLDSLSSALVGKGGT